MDQRLEARTRRLELQLRFLLAAWVVTIVASAALLLSRPVGSQKQSEQIDSLRVRQITVVDEKGIERIYIGSPVPDPMKDGRRAKRQKPSTGIVFNNIRGEEMSGWGVFDDESQNLCFDYKGAERLCLLQAGERAGLVIKDAKGSFLTMLGRIGYEEDGPKLFLNDRAGNVRIKLQAEQNEPAKMIEVVDLKGNVVSVVGDRSQQ